jgi:[calcium/calmodulin-dependent protein kinase] kinase
MKIVKKQNVGAMVNQQKKAFDLLEMEIAILKLLVSYLNLKIQKNVI